RAGTAARTEPESTAQATSAQDPAGAEALELPDGRLRAEFEASADAVELLLLGAGDLVRLEVDGVDHGVRVAHGAPLSLPLGPGRPHRVRAAGEIRGRADFDDARLPGLALGAGRGVGRVLEARAIPAAADRREVRARPDRRAGGGGAG